MGLSNFHEAFYISKKKVFINYSTFHFIGPLIHFRHERKQ